MLEDEQLNNQQFDRKEIWHHVNRGSSHTIVRPSVHNNIREKYQFQNINENGFKRKNAA